MGNDQILLDSLFMFTDYLRDDMHTIKDLTEVTERR